MTVRAFSFQLPASNVPPREFRIFRAGLNETTKGPLLFDEQAAAAVMAEYHAHGVDVMVDLNHETLKPAIRPDSHDARGWVQLEVRNGELWAVNARWTPDGDRRLREKTQRFVSPVVAFDGEHRVLEVINIALVGMPATDFAQPLVAASRAILARRALAATVSRNTMDPAQVKAAIEALKNGDGPGALTILEAMLVSAVTDGAEDAADGGADEATEPLAEGAAAPPVDPNADPKKKEEPMAKAYAALAQSAIDLATKQGKDLVSLTAQVATLTADHSKVDRAKRCAVVAQLIALGVETPATAWEKDAKGEPDATKPVKRLASESVEDMTARVAALSVGRPRLPAPPVRADGDAGSKTFTTSLGIVALSASEIKNCVELGAKPEAYAENKAIREAARSRGGSQ